MKDRLFLIVGIAIVVWSFYAFLQKPAPERYQEKINNLQQTIDDKEQRILKIGENELQVELADTEEKRVQGLSGRETLESGHGILFLFENPDFHGFWMKDMHFPIDIVWINEDSVVVGVEREVSPDTYPQIFSSNTKVKYVLEINSGEASSLGIDIGSELYLGY